MPIQDLKKTFAVPLDSLSGLVSATPRSQILWGISIVIVGLMCALAGWLVGVSLVAGVSLLLIASCLAAALYGTLTKLESTQRALRARRLIENAIYENAPDGITVTDKQGRVLFFNHAFEELMGFDEADILLEKPPYCYWAPEEREKTLATALSLLDETQASEQKAVLFEACRKDGSRFTCQVRPSPIRDERGRVMGFMFMHRDLSERARLEKALSQAHESLKLVLGGMAVGVSVMTQSGEFVYSNHRFDEIFDNPKRAHRRIVGELADQQQTEFFDDFSQLSLLARKRSITWVNGEPATLLTVADITVQKQTQQLLAEQMKKAEQSAKLITMGEMASSIAHELNQPLSAIQNYASAALVLKNQGKLNDKNGTEAIEKIIRQAQRAALIIRHVRGFSRRSSPNLTAVPVRQILEGTEELAVLLAKKFRIAFSSDVDPLLPDVYCDPVLIEQVLINFIRNAFEALDEAKTPEGLVRLTISAQAPGVLFSVSDNGPGLSDEVKENLFSPFFSTKHHGMGIGLNICRSIAETHQSRITVRDNPGGGAIFEFVLEAAQKS